MYLDRACLAWMLSSDSFRSEIPLSETSVRDFGGIFSWVSQLANFLKYNETGLLKSAFFLSYALAQVPAGWLAERFGKRHLLTLLVVIWSMFTALSGFSHGLAMLLVARLGCGIAEAGAYPISGSLLGRWSHANWRGFTSGVVSLGGRVGGALAPQITTVVILGLSGWLGYAGWRWAGWTYGLLGIFVAIVFWRSYRETPSEHPGCNEAERTLLAEGRGPELPRVRTSFPWGSILTDRSLWCMCVFQFLTNYGWAFAINSMSDYLKNVRHLNDAMNGHISTTALTLGLGGLLVGGFVTDACARRWGTRQGRKLPMVISRFVCAGLFLVCLQVENPWIFALCLGGMTFFTDAGLPAVWAWAQDVGGRQVAPIFGWANMWGNFGAALQPLVNGWVLARFDHQHDWHPSFIACSIAFALSGVFAMGIDAARPVKNA